MARFHQSYFSILRQSIAKPFEEISFERMKHWKRKKHIKHLSKIRSFVKENVLDQKQIDHVSKYQRHHCPNDLKVSIFAMFAKSWYPEENLVSLSWISYEDGLSWEDWFANLIRRSSENEVKKQLEMDGKGFPKLESVGLTKSSYRLFLEILEDPARMDRIDVSELKNDLKKYQRIATKGFDDKIAIIREMISEGQMNECQQEMFLKVLKNFKCDDVELIRDYILLQSY